MDNSIHPLVFNLMYPDTVWFLKNDQNPPKFSVIIQIIDSLSISFCRMMEKWGIKGVILLYRAVGARNCPHPIMPPRPLLLPHPHRRPLQRLCWSNLQKRLVPPKIQVLSCQVSNQMIPRLSLCQGKYYIVHLISKSLK